MDIKVSSMSDLTSILNRNHDLKEISVTFGFRFWGRYSYIMDGMTDPELDDDRKEFQEAIIDHPSITTITFKGPSFATLQDLAIILEAAFYSKTLSDISIPIVPPENYKDKRIRSQYIQQISYLLHRSKSIKTLTVIDMLESPSSPMTDTLQRICDSAIRVSAFKKSRKYRLSSV
jgi:hypothetical protein